MSRNLDNIKIIEPPLEELNKRHGWFFRTCLTGFVFILVFIIGLIIALRLAAGPGPQSLAQVPTAFPPDVPIYDKDNVNNITFISGRYKNRGIEIAALFPKLILSPLFWSLNKKQSPTTTEQSMSIADFWKIITTPVGDHRDSVQLEWRDLGADQRFVYGYYKSELKKKNFEITVESEGQGVRQFSFSRADGLSGSLYTKADPSYRNRTEYMILTINMGTSTAR